MSAKYFNKGLILIFSLVVFSCAKAFIEPDPKGDALKNFEVFWNDMNNNYPYFTRDKVNWQELHDKNVSRIAENTTTKQLYFILQDMLRPLKDGHISLESPDGETWQNEKYQSYFSQNYYGVYGNYNPAVNSYLKDPKKFITNVNEKDPTITDTVASYGYVGNDILYFHVYTYFTTYKFEQLLPTLIEGKPIKGIILDVRDNTGGNISTMLNFMGLFFQTPTTYAYFKQKIGPLDYNFSESVDYVINPVTPYINKPIVCLANRFTFSAGEHTVLAMRTRANTTIVGDTTGGGLSFIVQRTLPDGLKYIGVNSQTFDSKGNLYEGLGIPPQVSAENTLETNASKKDLPMDKALEILNK